MTLFDGWVFFLTTAIGVQQEALERLKEKQIASSEDIKKLEGMIEQGTNRIVANTEGQDSCPTEHKIYITNQLSCFSKMLSHTPCSSLGKFNEDGFVDEFNNKITNYCEVKTVDFRPAAPLGKIPQEACANYYNKLKKQFVDNSLKYLTSHCENSL